MKKFWTDETVGKKADKAGKRVQEWLVQKQAEMEEETGVRWSSSFVGGGWSFDPIDQGVDAPDKIDEKLVETVIEAYRRTSKDVTGYVSYWQAYESAKKLKLIDVIRVVRWLEEKGKAKRTVNRMGKGCAFKLT